MGGSGVVVEAADFSGGADVVVLATGLGFVRDFNEVLVSFPWLDSTLESLKYVFSLILRLMYNIDCI